MGASSGIGEQLVRQLATQGYKVAALARRRDRLEELARELPHRVVAYQHDVTEYDSIPELFQEVCKDLGGLDLIIYAAGVMPRVAIDEFEFEKDKATIDVNLLGAMAWLDQAAVRFQGVQHGTIVAIGSVAGDRGRAGQPAYNTSKAALATYMEALRNRLSRYGVKVVTVKPGPTDTDMATHASAKKVSAAKAAALILKKSGRTGEHYLLLPHKIIFAIIRNIPSPIFRRMRKFE